MAYNGYILNHHAGKAYKEAKIITKLV